MSTTSFSNWKGNPNRNAESVYGDPRDAITWQASQKYSHDPAPVKPARPLRALKIPIPSTRKFEAAEGTDLLADWGRSNISTDSDLYSALPSLRARAKDLCQNNHFAKRFLRLLETNVIGPDGIKLQMGKLDSQGKPDKRVNDVIEEGWKDFLDRRNFTVTGRVPGVAAQNLMIKASARGGEVIIRKIKSFRHNKHRFAIQFIDPERLDHNKNEALQNGNFCRMGIEFDQWRRPVRYHFTEHYGDLSLPRSSHYKRDYSIPADEIIHAFIPDFEEQSRGYTWFHAAMKQLRHLGAFQEAAIVEARVGASKMGFYKPERDANGEWVGDDENDDGTLVQEATAGSFEELPRGYTLETWDPKNPNSDHAGFSKSMLKGIAAGLCVSYPSLGADLEGVNYSSIRAGHLEDRDGYKMLQNYMIDAILRDIFESWLEVQLMHDAVLPNWMTADRFDGMNKARFEGRKWAWVDPAKDIGAEVVAMENKIKSRSRIQREMGIDPEEEQAAIAADEAINGPVNPEAAPEPAPAAAAAPAAAPAKPDAEDDEEE